MILIWMLVFLYFSKDCESSNPISVKKFKDYILVTWNQTKQPPPEWTILHNIFGTGFHGVVKVPGNETRANISTLDYPGVMYVISLYANKTEIPIGTAYCRSDCETHIDAVLGTTYNIQSHGYPRELTTGTICSWTITGNDNTWYSIEIVDVDFGKNNSCKSFLNINSLTLCDNETDSNVTIYVQNSTLGLHLMHKNNKGRGFQLNVTAVQKIDMPTNFTANITENRIHARWEAPVHHPQHYWYILRLSYYPFNSHIDFNISSNSTEHTIDVSSHFGQNYNLQIQSVSKEFKCPFTQPLTVKTTCDYDIYIKATERFQIVSEQYPNRYLPLLGCHYKIHTDKTFLLRFKLTDINIDGGSFCEKTFVQIGNGSKYCSETQPTTDLIVNQSDVIVVFQTEEHVNGKGINFTVSSVANKPSEPQWFHGLSTDGFIQLFWRAPLEQQTYIKGYIIRYDVNPATPGATIEVSQNVFNYSINTDENLGRLYTIRISAFTDGGQGHFTPNIFVRAKCEQTIRLATRLRPYHIMPPVYREMYQAAVVCQWHLETEPAIWIKLNIHKLNLEFSNNCSKDYVDIIGEERLCGDLTSARSIIIKKSKVNITFVSDFNLEGAGFDIIAMAVGPTPGKPETVSVSTSGYGLLVSWGVPLFNRDYVSGYIINYMFGDETFINSINVTQNSNSCFIDTTSYPGRKFDVWLQSAGDVDNSPSTNISRVRTECGRVYINQTERLLISSPYYGNNPYNNITCKWEIRTEHTTDIKVMILKINLRNKFGCSNQLQIGRQTCCDDSCDGIDVLINKTAQLTLAFTTGRNGAEAGFLLQVDILKPTVV